MQPNQDHSKLPTRRFRTRTSFGTWLKTAREDVKLTQAEAAELIGVTQTTWSTWERGKSMPSTPYSNEIAGAFALNRETMEHHIQHLRDRNYRSKLPRTRTLSPEGLANIREGAKKRVGVKHKAGSKKRAPRKEVAKMDAAEMSALTGALKALQTALDAICAHLGVAR